MANGVSSPAGLTPVFAELHGLVVKTIGLVEPLRHALPKAAGIRAAFVYGSVAKGTAGAKGGRRDSFVARIASQPKLFVIGSEDDLA